MSEEKENLNSNLALSRHQYLQACINLDKMQESVLNLKKRNLEISDYYSNIIKSSTSHDCLKEKSLDINLKIK